ncbi:unnamed protein product [Heligmosomoides polygyrus]|uniref:Roadblock/LC7 domain-containing protein n=1 Tax=Heligmosomoides polygyrus TaxID=6339 RepID=A0A183GR01_HELPZ|nr:unnamed protein product [Heligmosomoides polygyrus]
MSFYKKTNTMNGVVGATAGYEAALVGGKPDDLANTSMHNSLEYFHSVLEQSDWAWMAVCIADGKELLDTLALAMACFGKSIKLSFTIARLEFLIDTIIMRRQRQQPS